MGERHKSVLKEASPFPEPIYLAPPIPHPLLVPHGTRRGSARAAPGSSKPG